MGPPPPFRFVHAFIKSSTSYLKCTGADLVVYENHFEFAMNIFNLHFFWGGGVDKLTKWYR